MANFNYNGRVVEAASKDDAIRKILAFNDEVFEGTPDPHNDQDDGRDPNARYTDDELRAMAKKECDKLKAVIEGARIDMDFLQKLSYKIAREKLGVDGLTIEANFEPLFSYGHKNCWGNKTWNGSNDELKSFRIEGLGCLDYVYFDVSNCKAKLSSFDVVNMHKMGNTWVWDDYASGELTEVSYDDL